TVTSYNLDIRLSRDVTKIFLLWRPTSKRIGLSRRPNEPLAKGAAAHSDEPDLPDRSPSLRRESGRPAHGFLQGRVEEREGRRDEPLVAGVDSADRGTVAGGGRRRAQPDHQGRLGLRAGQGAVRRAKIDQQQRLPARHLCADEPWVSGGIFDSSRGWGVRRG